MCLFFLQLRSCSALSDLHTFDWRFTCFSRLRRRLCHQRLLWSFALHGSMAASIGERLALSEDLSSPIPAWLACLIWITDSRSGILDVGDADG
jgi:hypothetical protein